MEKNEERDRVIESGRNRETDSIGRSKRNYKNGRIGNLDKRKGESAAKEEKKENKIHVGPICQSHKKC
jgi:hypothetical protein